MILGIFLILAIYSHIETKLLKITEYTVESDRIPGTLSGRRLVLLSDLHNTYFGKDNSRLLQMVEGSAPDIIVVAGDLVNGRSSRKQFKYGYRLLERLKELGKPLYYEFGNHEYRIDGAFNCEGPFREYKNKCGEYAMVLNNAASGIDEFGTRIYGLTLPSEQFDMKVKLGLKEPVSHFLGEPDPDRYNILIAHDPSYYEEYIDWGADLVLSGHIHGGIIRLPLIGGLLSPRYSFFPKVDKGIYRRNKGVMIASGGIGWHGFPFRFMNRPEVVVIDFKRITGN